MRGKLIFDFSQLDPCQKPRNAPAVRFWPEGRPVPDFWAEVEVEDRGAVDTRCPATLYPGQAGSLRDTRCTLPLGHSGKHRVEWE